MSRATSSYSTGLPPPSRKIPETYREALRELSTLAGFPGEAVTRASDFTRIRNLLAYEYLDMRYPEIRQFVTAAPAVYGEIARAVRHRMAREA